MRYSIGYKRNAYRRLLHCPRLPSTIVKQLVLDAVVCSSSTPWCEAARARRRRRGVLGVASGYLLASLLLPDVAASLRGLYGDVMTTRTIPVS